MNYFTFLQKFLSIAILFNHFFSISAQYNLKRNLVHTLIDNLKFENYGPLNVTEYEKMQKIFDQFKTLLLNLNNINSGSVGFLTTNFERNLHKDSTICRGCLWIFNHFHDIVYKYYNKIGIFEFVKFICKNILNIYHKECDGYIDNYAPIILESLFDHYFTGDYICTRLSMCENSHFSFLEADEYAKKLLKDKPKNISKAVIEDNSTTWRMLHIADIHTDLHYTEGSLGNCKDPICCRNSTNQNEFYQSAPQEKAGKWGYLGNCDLPLITLINFLEFIVNDIKPDFIIWTGDNPSHANWEESTQQEIFDISSFFTKYLMEKFNNTIPVYPSLGNHEKFPTDQFYPFDKIGENHLLQYFGNLWKNWLGEEAYQEFIKYGYYTKKHLNTNLRIVSYNCLYCDAINFFLIKNPTDPNNQINWLENILRSAETNNEVIYLIGHISAGDISLLSECAKRYKALIDRFSHIIRGQFAGHTHNDELKILHEYFNEDIVTGIVFIAPSLTTHSYYNPSFRLFEIDSNTKLPKDYLQYRLNITKANQGDNVPEWEIAYRATEFFGLKYLDELEIIKTFVSNIEKDQDIFLRVCRAFFSDGPKYKICITNKRMPKYLSCRFKNDIFNNFFSCIKWQSWNSQDYYIKLLNVLGGKWYQSLPHQ